MPAQTARRAGAVADRLAAELRARIRGEVRFGAGDLALYATDASNYRQLPIGVVVPRDVPDLIEAVAVARDFGAPVLARGGGTSLAGQCCNHALVLDTSKYLDRIVEIDAERRRARVEPGVILDDLRAAAERHHLTFGPDPATHNHCTLGGMIGNDACGVHSVMAGRTSHNVEALEVLTYDGVRLRVGATPPADLERIIAEGGRRGEIYAGLKDLVERYAPLIRARYPDIPRRVSGYNLPALLPENGFHVARALVGSEGTCVAVLEATVNLVHSPPARVLVTLGYADVYAAAEDVPRILTFGPIGLEGMDHVLVEDMRRQGLHSGHLPLLPPGAAWLLVEFGADTAEEAHDRARTLMDALAARPGAPSMRRYTDPAEARRVWAIRESGLGATARVPGRADTWEGWEDAAVAPERLAEYLRGLHGLYRKYGYRGALYGHFGEGCVHTRTTFDLASAEGIARFRAFIDEAADLVLALGGSLSGEHGDGHARAELLPRMFGPELMEAFRAFKRLWDPDGRMNPGKVVDPFAITEHLRLGAAYRPLPLVTRFRFPADDGSFARATLRCVGVGECRRMQGGTMCPSYRATREEMHSTRGRAHLLWEMASGKLELGGWDSEAIHEALDLCLACKGCKAECPVNVDVATYKAEFYAHHYAGRRRPRAAYSMGLIHRWARLAALAPGVANAVTQTRGLDRLVRRLAGITPERAIPRFAPQTFRRLFRRRGRRAHSGPPVLLWPDTFNNYFHPETALAACEVLEAAGHRVMLPPRGLCCGRPLYDFGMLDLARRLLLRTLEALRPEIEAGIPVVCLEPSCIAVFKDEMTNLLPDDPRALRLRDQTFLLDEFIALHAPEFRPPPLRRRALVHAHCHHKALFGTGAAEAALANAGLAYEVLDSGCCGLAGSFGFEPHKYRLSMEIGELVLLPAVRAAPPDTLIISDGFSCREQVRHGTGRRAFHLAEVLRMALTRERTA